MTANGWYWTGQAIIFVVAQVLHAPWTALIAGQLVMVVWLLLFGTAHDLERAARREKKEDA